MLNTKQLAISWMLYHQQTSTYLLSQLFFTYLGVALLLLILFDVNDILCLYVADEKARIIR